jgi:hypothetical protein
MLCTSNNAFRFLKFRPIAQTDTKSIILFKTASNLFERNNKFGFVKKK